MQTDVWLTETSNEDTCPLCSKPLKRGAQTCFTCGFSRNSPTVWIDPTVHGYQHVMPQHTTNQLTPDPQAASPVWQYESPHFEAAGSLPMLSLFLPETPTQPQPPVPNKLTTRRLPRVDEIDTQPPQMSPARDIDQFDTQPPAYRHEQRALILASPTAPMAAVEKESRSWTAGTALGSPSAQLIMRPSRRHRLPRVSSFHPLDQARWWLLRPGRIEFILWLGGTVLLIGVTCLLLFVCALSFQWIAPFAPASPLASSAGNNTQRHTVPPDGAGPFIMLENTGSLVPGRSFQLHGQGFKPASKVTFYLDDKLSLLNQGHQTAWTQVDAHGTFDLTLWLSTGAGWAPGPHMLIARDATDGQSAIMPVQLAASSSAGGTVASASPTPTSGSPSGNTSTGNPTPTPQGPQSTPVSRPPVTVTPTLPPVTPTPSPTHAPPPTVTPTAATSPTVTPTPASSPASGTPTPGVSPTSSSTGLGNALNDSGVPPVASRLGSVSPLVWIMLTCYLLSMFSLGAAGIIHRRHRKMIM